jgi:hypothetical protein
VRVAVVEARKGVPSQIVDLMQKVNGSAVAGPG